MDETSTLPFPSISEVKIKNDEPLTYAYFNVHMLRLLQNIRSINKTTTLQKATPIQWGVVKIATVDDIISEDGNRNSVITNKVLLEAIDTLKNNNLKSYKNSGKLTFSKNYEWTHGEFVVGVGENIAKRITSSPDMVVYANVYFVPLGCDNIPFRMANSRSGVDNEYFKKTIVTSGVINFDKVDLPKQYRDFHVYYHNSGYVICRNEKIQDYQKQVKIVWNLLTRK